jgi:Protein of unknown function (DUF1553)/Protein of unknown function (DUF1549)/Planctomycete cytochrome C
MVTFVTRRCSTFTYLNFVFFTFLLASVAPTAQESSQLPPAAEARVDFLRDVQPVLATRCHVCHGPSQQMNGLRLDSREAALKGGYTGPVIVPAKSPESKLILRVASSKDGFRMPPAGPPLTPKEVGILRAWIDQGAEWAETTTAPKESQASTGQKKSEHWAFRPIQRAQLPAVKQNSWVRNPIDAFVLARLESAGAAPSPEADKITQIRRLSFDLIGLPPTLQEVEQFLADDSPEAYERVVDRLLDSPHYGEKWARHWLDLARYADSDGYEKDQARPYAWRWRHWVIEALNRDMPFDQFTRQQIAGDLLPRSSPEPVVATGFHHNGLKNREAGVKREEARFEEMVDRTNTVGTVWLGLTVGCAQCHDHKYDPISQKDYYQLFAFLNNTQDVVVDAPLPGELGPYLQARPDYYKKRNGLLEEGRVLEMQAQWEAKIRQAKEDPGKNLDWDYALTEVRAMVDAADRLLRKQPDQRTQKENDELTDYFIGHPGPEIAKDKGTSERFKELQKKLQELDKSFPALSQAYAVIESPEPVRTHIAVRGDYKRDGLEVQADTPNFLPPLSKNNKLARIRLAEWLVSRENPLTSRVVVNRMWQEFFGRGLVRTSEDFGTQGEKPTHPELLDWLAAEFMDRGWSMKQMHKLVVMSATYRQSSQARPELKDRDPDNTLLAKQNRLRLTAEGVRDAALSASGLLYPSLGGESVRPPQPESVSKLTYGGAKWEESQGKDRYRRGLYIHYQRTSPYPQLVNFDEPNSNTACTRRPRSNTPLQALNLLNDPVFSEAAQSLAIRALEEAPRTWESRLETLFQLCLSRKPSPNERERMARYFEKQKAIFQKDNRSVTLVAPNPVPGVEPAELATWVGLGRVLMNLDEFITRE